MSIWAALPGNASRTRKMISDAPSSVASSVRNRRSRKTLILVLRARSSHHVAASPLTNFGIEEHSQTIKSCGFSALPIPPHDPTCPVARCKPPAIAPAPSAGPAGKQVVRCLEQRACTQQLDIPSETADELKSDRKAVTAKSAWQADGRMAGHVE